MCVCIFMYKSAIDGLMDPPNELTFFFQKSIFFSKINFFSKIKFFSPGNAGTLQLIRVKGQFFCGDSQLQGLYRLTRITQFCPTEV